MSNKAILQPNMNGVVLYEEWDVVMKANALLKRMPGKPSMQQEGTPVRLDELDWPTLAELAKRHGWTIVPGLMAHPDKLLADQRGDAHLLRETAQVAPMTRVTERSHPDAYNHWGINE